MCEPDEVWRLCLDFVLQGADYVNSYLVGAQTRKISKLLIDGDLQGRVCQLYPTLRRTRCLRRLSAWLEFVEIRAGLWASSGDWNATRGTHIPKLDVWRSCRSRPSLPCSSKLSSYVWGSAIWKQILLHWLPIRQRIAFKIAVFVYNALHGRGPTYLSRTCNPVRKVGARAHLRSAIRGDLTVPRTRTRRLGPRSFRVSGPVVWNSLPEDIWIPELSLDRFKYICWKHIYFAKHMPSSTQSAFVTWLRSA